MKIFRDASITYKLFGIQFIGMVVCLSIAFVLVWTGFQSFYTNHKLESLEQAFISEFDTSFAKDSLSINDIYHQIESFEADQQATAIVLEIGVMTSSDINYEMFHNPQRSVSQYELNFISGIVDRQIDMLVAAKQEQKITSFFAEDDTGRSAFLLAVPLGADMNRILLVVAPDDPIIETTEVIREYMGIVFVLALLVSLIIAYLFSRAVTRPMKKIEDVTTKIAALDFTEKIDYPFHDEVGQLAGSVNRLAGRLDAALTRLRKELEYKNEFLGAVSHELKTPIALVEGYAEMLQELSLSTEQRNHYARIIQKESEKMDKILNDLLQLTRMSSGEESLEKQSFPINVVISEVIEHLRPLWIEKKLRMTHYPVDFSIQLHADLRRIDQLVTNLLTNAIRHTPTEGEVNISCELVKDMVRIEVRNEGEPIPTDELDRIWEPFVRVEKSRSRDTGGTGIGLSIVKSIVTLHGGSCHVENVKDGVLFRIKLPK